MRLGTLLRSGLAAASSLMIVACGRTGLEVDLRNPGPDSGPAAIERDAGGVDAAAPDSAVVTPEDSGLPWPMIGQGPGHQARNLSASEPSRAPRSWELPVGDVAHGSCLIAAGGRIYATTASGLVAVSREGAVEWAVPIEFSSGESPSAAVAADGTVIVRTSSDSLSAFSPAGAAVWERRFETEHGVLSSPTIAPDGTAYMALVDGPLLVLRPDGSSGALGASGMWSTPAISRDGTITVIGVSTFLSRALAFAPDGGPLFDAPLTHPNAPDGVYGYQGYPSSGPDGSTYVSTDMSLIALDRTGHLLWSAPKYGLSNAGPAVGADGTIYEPDAPLTAYNPDGTVKWRYTPAGGSAFVFAFTAAVGPDGNIYVGGDRLYVVSPDGAIVRIVAVAGSVSTQLAIDDDGTVIFGSDTGKLYAR